MNFTLKWQDFYLNIRRALLHPSCNPGYEWSNPSTLDEWKKDPSRKLDILCELLKWHLQCDGQTPLQVVNDKLVPCTRIDVDVSPAGELVPCDKIIVYCAFPSSYTQVTKVSERHGITLKFTWFILSPQVLDLHKIQSLQLYGKLSVAIRTSVVEKFKASGVDGPRVLILSDVGLTGLNLPCANILIIAVRLYIFPHVLF